MIRGSGLLIGALLSLSANVANAGWIDTFKKIVPFFELYENASETAEVFDYLWRTGPEVNEEIEERLKSARNYHPKAHVLPPKVNADQAFSKFPEVRDGVRGEWTDFLKNERSEIARLQQRRQQHRLGLAHYEAQLRAMEKAKDVLWGLSKDPNSVTQYEFAKKAAELEGLLPQVANLVGEHRRILKEFDALIARKQGEAKAHLKIQEMLEFTKELPTHLDPAEMPSKHEGSSSGPSTTPSPGDGSPVDRTIDRAVGGVSGGFVSKTEQERRRADERHKMMTERNDAIAAREKPNLTGSNNAGRANTVDSLPGGKGSSSSEGGNGNLDSSLETTVPTSGD